MKVIKRNGKVEEVKLEKVTKRVDKLSYGLNVQPLRVSQKVIAGINDGITTTQIDALLTETAAMLGVDHPDYLKLAARIAVSSLHKCTKGFYQTMKDLYKDGTLSEEFIDLVRKYGKEVEKYIESDRDLEFEYFGYKTLEKSYFLKINGAVVERPQHMFMRVALAIGGDDLEKVKKLYDSLSTKKYTHATPTLFNAGTKLQQMSSCFLVGMESDSIEGIYNTAKECALISKNAGGIGLHIHNVRAKGSHIKGTNGTSNGIVPMLKVFNETARYVDQCFHPDTIIYTKNGIKKIKDVFIGDEVINSSGNLERITKVFRRNINEDLSTFKLYMEHSNKPIVVTGAHPLMVIRDKNLSNNKTIKNSLENFLIKPEFISVSDLTENDMVGFSIPKHEQDLSEYSLDDCKFYGHMLADGHLSSTGLKSYICGNPKKSDFAFFKNYLYSCGIQFTESIIDHDYNRLVFSPHLSDNLFKFDRIHFYDDDGKKNLHQLFLHLPIDKIKQIIVGLLESYAVTDVPTDQNSISLSLYSEKLAESLKYIFLRIGVLTSVNKGHSYFELVIPKTEIISDMLNFKDTVESSFRYRDIIFTRIKKIEEDSYTQGLVYDLLLEGPNHDYLTHGGIAHNGGGKRKGSFAIYLEPWHADIEAFLELRKNTGKEEFRARDLFYALWTPDLFMKRVKEDREWTLMCPHECPGLSDTYGKNFEDLYTKYEQEGKGRHTLKARELWAKVLESQIETGLPYMLYKDACNEKSNQKNIGVIKSSNLCFTGDTVVAVADGYNGRSIKELAEWSKGTIKFPVYSASEKDVKIIERSGGKQRIGPWKDEIKLAVAFKTGTKKVFEVSLENGDTFKCTGDHELALAYGGYVNAIDSVGKELQSFFTYTPTEDKIIEKCVNYLPDENLDHRNTDKNGLEFSDIIASKIKEEFYFEDSNGVLCKKGTKVASIKELGNEDVYDLTVEDNHNFYIITSTLDSKFNNSKGILVHNCTEILEVSDSKETAVCNLASISLPAFVKEDESGIFYDYKGLHEVVKTATENLNIVIDKNYYPTPKTKVSNMRHRPIGLGVQGLANVFFMFKIAYDSPQAKEINIKVFETIYHAALEASCELAYKNGTYETFQGSPASFGILQHDMWGVTPSDLWDWDSLRADIVKHGLRNSLLVAPMPTASTASIFGNVEAFEAQTSNIYKRQVLSGEYVITNSYLVKDLEELGLWNDKIRNKIIEEGGSVQNIPEIPTHIKEIYKTIWEISQKVVIDMAADRGAFIDQSQSLNLWLAKPNFGNLNSMHFYGWEKGLKTGMYYLRSKPAMQAQKVTTEIKQDAKEFTTEEALVCSLENPENCEACGS